MIDFAMLHQQFLVEMKRRELAENKDWNLWEHEDDAMREAIDYKYRCHDSCDDNC